MAKSFLFRDTIGKELIKELGEEFKRTIEETDLEVYEIGYKKMKEKE